MLTPQQIWNLYDQYVEAWKPIPLDQRTKIVHEVMAEDLDYLTPHVQGSRPAVLDDMAAFNIKYPGCYFTIDDLSTHHDVALFTWVLVQADGTVMVKGHDQIRLSPEGQIVAVLTFSPSTARP